MYGKLLAGDRVSEQRMLQLGRKEQDSWALISCCPLGTLMGLDEQALRNVPSYQHRWSDTDVTGSPEGSPFTSVFHVPGVERVRSTPKLTPQKQPEWTQQAGSY